MVSITFVGAVAGIIANVLLPGIGPIQAGQQSFFIPCQGDAQVIYQRQLALGIEAGNTDNWV